MMARVYDEGEYGGDRPEIDNQVFCPRCGIADVEIISEPRPGSWWGTFGRARCNDCGCEFSIQFDEDGGDGNQA